MTSNKYDNVAGVAKLPLRADFTGSIQQRSFFPLFSPVDADIFLEGREQSMQPLAGICNHKNVVFMQRLSV